MKKRIKRHSKAIWVVLSSLMLGIGMVGLVDSLLAQRNALSLAYSLIVGIGIAILLERTGCFYKFDEWWED